MDRIKKQIEVSELLVGKVLGSLTEEQGKTLQDWEQQSNNKEIADNILDADEFSAWNKKLNSIDTEKEWNSFVEQMEASAASHRKVLRLKTIKWVSSIAAVFLIGLAVFSLFKYTSSDNKHQTIEGVAITPGSSHAELVLSNGEVVNLGKNSKKALNEGGVALDNAKGVLQYNDSKTDKLVGAKENTLRVPRGAEYQLVLSDGTKVWLNSDTELTYAVAFVGSQRRVSLKGEAYFEVAHNKEVPFIVSTGNQEVQVLGTEFNISAYSDDIDVLTTLVKGKVKVSSGRNTVNTNVFLLPNEQSIFNKNTDNIQKKSVDTYPYVAWKEGRFVFDNVSLEQFLSKVSRWYNVEVIFKDNSVKKLRFTGDLPRYSDISSVLKIVEAETSVHIKVENNKYIYIYK